MPVETTGTSGVKYTTEIQTIKRQKSLTPKNRHRESVEKIVASAKSVAQNPGIQSLTPKSLYEPASKSVHSGEDVEELKEKRVTPNTPCVTRFLAIAI